MTARHLFALGVVCADVGELPADVEQHVVLSRSPLLHEIRGEHPGPEHDAVILKTTCRNTNKKKIYTSLTDPLCFCWKTNISQYILIRFVFIYRFIPFVQQQHGAALRQECCLMDFKGTLSLQLCR